MQFILAILLLSFLFSGEPDLYDNLHRIAMRATSTESCK